MKKKETYRCHLAIMEALKKRVGIISANTIQDINLRAKYLEEIPPLLKHFKVQLEEEWIDEDAIVDYRYEDRKRGREYRPQKKMIFSIKLNIFF